MLSLTKRMLEPIQLIFKYYTDISHGIVIALIIGSECYYIISDSVIAYMATEAIVRPQCTCFTSKIYCYRNRLNKESMRALKRC